MKRIAKKCEIPLKKLFSPKYIVRADYFGETFARASETHNVFDADDFKFQDDAEHIVGQTRYCSHVEITKICCFIHREKLSQLKLRCICRCLYSGVLNNVINVELNALLPT